MRVLHLNKNFASVMSTNVLAQRSIGVDARGFVFGAQPLIVSNNGLTLMPDRGAVLPRYLWFLRQFLWADIVHWYWGTPILPKGRDLGLLKRLRKPCVIEWLGSDVRRFEVDMLDNLHFRELWLENEEF